MARLGEVLSLLLVLGKARVVGLVTFTALTAVVVGANGRPSADSLLAVLAIGALAGGGAGALNHVLDRDIDRHMARTRARPLVTGRLQPRLVAALGCVWIAAGLAVAAATGPMVLAHTLVAAATYLVVYTRLLKRHTPQSVVIGGWTGAAAVLAGWEATGRPLEGSALALAAVVFFWTPGHFWALALARIEEYRHAGVPALPVVAGAGPSTLAIAASAAATFAAAAVPLLEGRLGLLYAAGLAVAAVLWGRPTYLLVRAAARQRATRAAALRTFAFSNVSLLLLFTAALLDSVLRAA